MSSAQEAEADRWSHDFLIPAKYDAALPNLRSKQAVIEFAKQIGIHPGIVVGRLQHDQLIAKDWMNGLKAKVQFEDS